MQGVQSKKKQQVNIPILWTLSENHKKWGGDRPDNGF
jgi:hypothetical protein